MAKKEQLREIRLDTVINEKSKREDAILNLVQVF